MGAGQAPDTDAAMEVLEQILTDKGRWADSLGALSPWTMHGTAETIVTDCGKPFLSKRFCNACVELGIVAERVQAGVPEMRGVGERVFRTVESDLCRRFAGNTFHELISDDRSRDRPTGMDQAVLHPKDLANAMTRWVIDDYHRSPHAGLGGETPLAC